MMKLWLAVLLLVFLGDPTAFHPEKVWLFSKKQYPGNVPVHTPGTLRKEPSVLLFCYIEIKKGAALPVWQAAYFNGRKFSVNGELMKEDSVILGTIKNTGAAAVIKPDPGCQVIHLALTEAAGEEKTKKDGFILTGKMDKQDVVLTSKEPVIELSPDLMP